MQNGLRKKMINAVKLSAMGKFHEAISCTYDYINVIKMEQKNAEEAIEIRKKLLAHMDVEDNNVFLTRKQTSDYRRLF